MVVVLTLPVVGRRRHIAGGEQKRAGWGSVRAKEGRRRELGKKEKGRRRGGGRRRPMGVDNDGGRRRCHDGCHDEEPAVKGGGG